MVPGLSMAQQLESSQCVLAWNPQSTPKIGDPAPGLT